MKTVGSLKNIKNKPGSYLVKRGKKVFVLNKNNRKLNCKQ